MVIYHQLRNRELAHRLGENAEPLHIGDVEHDEDIRLFQSLGSSGTGVADVVAEEELVHLGPRRRVYDLGADTELT